MPIASIGLAETSSHRYEERGTDEYSGATARYRGYRLYYGRYKYYYYRSVLAGNRSESIITVPGLFSDRESAQRAAESALLNLGRAASTH